VSGQITPKTVPTISCSGVSARHDTRRQVGESLAEGPDVCRLRNQFLVESGQAGGIFGTGLRNLIAHMLPPHER
jgi:hypothetical protein